MFLNLDGIIIILLSIVFPSLLIWRGELDREIEKTIKEFYTYLNEKELNRSENYYRFRKFNQKEMIKFLTEEVKIEKENKFLLPGRSPSGDNLVRYWQEKLKRLPKRKNMVGGGMVALVVVVICFCITKL